MRWDHKKGFLADVLYLLYILEQNESKQQSAPHVNQKLIC